MRPIYLVVLTLAVALAGCRSVSVSPVSTWTYRPSDVNFANPERGYKYLTYFEHAPFDNAANATMYRLMREQDKLTLHQHVYYLSDFMEGDISQEYLDALDANMQVLRESGCKCILRFAYKHEMEEEDKPFDPSPDWVNRHIEQLQPYLIKNEDVIFCLEAGFIGVWGEWGYTSGYTQLDWPYRCEQLENRWETLDHLLAATPVSRQICLRTPFYKKCYLSYHGQPDIPVSESTAHRPTALGRLAAHNDCFLSADDDFGTYLNDDDREFWKQDTRFTVMGGEICMNCEYSDGDRAVQTMEDYHYTFLNDGTWNDIRDKWEASGHWEEICRRMGYRLVLDETSFKEGKPEGDWVVNVTLHNEGFAAPMNPRAVELVLVQGADTLVFPQNNFYPYMADRQTVDPRFWQPGEPIYLRLTASLPSYVKGEYIVYLNLPDPCPSLHDNPSFSIRIANKNIWNANAGYNRLGTVTF
ncbi:MAG: DUF4832 domain-containing protein [Paludibacteraceae bacterium]|nr:DUF4832 domain-containing protein [Paludibacteraceae bacterium]